MEFYTRETDGLTLSRSKGYIRFPDLGINPSRDTQLNIVSIPATLARLKHVHQVDTTYLMAFHQPFSGTHLGKVVEAVSRAQRPDVAFGTIVDIAVMLDAVGTGKIKNFYIGDRERNLYADHLNDPDIGPAFKEFMDSHSALWKTALEDHSMEGMFKFTQYPRLKRVNSKLEVEQFKDSWSKISENDYDGNNLVRQVVRGSILFYDGGLFENYLLSQPELGSGRGIELRDYYARNCFTWWLGNPNHVFRELGFNNAKRIQLFDGFIKSLSPDQLTDITMMSTQHRFGPFLYDPDIQKVWEPDSQFPTQSTPIDKNKLLFYTNNGSATSVVLTENQEGNFDWRITDYRLNDRDCANGLSAVIAYRKSPGIRTFLKQAELTEALKNFGITVPNPDAVFGRTLLAYGSDIPNTWSPTMQLAARPGHDQQMMALQTAVRISVPEYTEQLLSDSNPVISSLEGAFPHN